MIVVLPTVKKTGTGFVRHTLLSGFDRFGEQEAARKGRTDNYILNAHPTGVRWDEMQRAVQTYPSISPLRHPDAVNQSWIRRGWDLQDLTRSWRALDALVATAINHFWLPLDHPDRDTYLAAINTSLGLGLTTDWEPFHSAYGDGARVRGTRPRWLMNIYA